MDELLITPVPVDLRLWMQDVILGWKTIAQGQQWLAANPESYTAQRIAALSLVDGVVEQVAADLIHETYLRIVLCSQYRDVVLACQRDFADRYRLSMESLYSGTPDKKRTAKLKRFHANRVPILGVQVKDSCPMDGIQSHEWLWIDREPHPLFAIGTVMGRVRVVRKEKA